MKLITLPIKHHTPHVDTHVQGATRHTAQWEAVNVRAAKILEENGIYNMASVMPKILLYVLDGQMHDQGLSWDDARRCWK